MQNAHMRHQLRWRRPGDGEVCDAGRQVGSQGGHCRIAHPRHAHQLQLPAVRARCQLANSYQHLKCTGVWHLLAGSFTPAESGAATSKLPALPLSTVQASNVNRSHRWLFCAKQSMVRHSTWMCVLATTTVNMRDERCKQTVRLFC